MYEVVIVGLDRDDFHRTRTARKRPLLAPVKHLFLGQLLWSRQIEAIWLRVTVDRQSLNIV